MKPRHSPLLWPLELRLSRRRLLRVREARAPLEDVEPSPLVREAKRPRALPALSAVPWPQLLFRQPPLLVKQERAPLELEP